MEIPGALRPSPNWEPFLQRLKILYADMDRQYQIAADQHDFDCQGCTDNCCQTRFYHHTVVEFLYLQNGFVSLNASVRCEARRRAERDRMIPDLPDPAQGRRRPFCPLNTKQRCTLYAHRPMICRLHGIAYIFHPPGRPVQRGSGCAEFDRQVQTKAPIRFDRTPHYAALADLESELKQAMGLGKKIKMTISEMVMKFKTSP